MTPIILIRADASSRIGTGHIMRCLTLAHALRTRGYRVLFLTRSLSGNINNKIEVNGFELKHILSESLEDEIKEVTSLINETSAQLIIFDHYGIDETYEKSVTQSSDVTIFSFDDTFERHHCDLLLNQNIYAKKEAYNGLVPESCTLLCGTEFALIRDEFKSSAKRLREVALPKNLHLLITLGGADPDNITLKILKALENISEYEISADVVVGASNAYSDTLEQYANNSRHRLNIIVNASNMSELMNSADIAISGGGSTTIELIYMSVPSLILVLAENQRRIAEYMQANRLALALDADHSLDEATIKNSLLKIIEKSELRKEFLQNMQHHSIGNIDKLVKAAECKLYSHYLLRKATENDLLPLFELSNTPQVRLNSLNSNPITLEEHTGWFKTRVHQPDSPFLVVEKKGIFLGQVRLDNKEEGYVVSISLTERLQGCGYAKHIVKKALTFLPKESRAVAYIKTSNSASLSIFEKNGFHIVETTSINTIPTHKLIKEITA